MCYRAMVFLILYQYYVKSHLLCAIGSELAVNYSVQKEGKSLNFLVRN
jgi:hypothetical protein